MGATVNNTPQQPNHEKQLQQKGGDWGTKYILRA